MKRIISLCCVCLIFVMSLAVPARAADFNNDTWLDVLDYGFANGGTSNSVYVGTGTSVTYSLPLDVTLYTLDMVVYSAATINGVSVSRYEGDTLSFDLDVLNLGDNYYRIYGSLEGYFYSSLCFTFNMAWATNVNFIQIHVLPVVAEHFETTAYGSGYYGEDGVINVIADLSVVDVPRSQQIYYSGDYSMAYFTMFVEFPEWRKFDYVDLQLFFNCVSVTSVAAHFNETVVPLSISEWQNSVATTDYFMTVRLDLRGLDRSSSENPQLIVTGKLGLEEANTISLMNVGGYIVSSDTNPLLYYFSTLFAKLDTYNNHLVLSEQEQAQLIISALQDLGDLISLDLDTHFANLQSWIQNQTDITELGFSNLMLEIQDFSLMVEVGFGNVVSWISALTDALDVWLSRIETNIVSAIRGDTAPGDAFQEQVDHKDQQMDDMAAVMDSVTKPAIQDINVSVDQYIDSTDVQVLATPLTVFLEADLFRTMIILSILMATVSFTLYGKR